MTEKKPSWRDIKVPILPLIFYLAVVLVAGFIFGTLAVDAWRAAIRIPEKKLPFPDADPDKPTPGFEDKNLKKK